MRLLGSLPPALFLLLLPNAVHAATAGAIEVVANTRVAAMMMFLGNTDKIYILDKAEGNAEQINGHSAWASVYDLNSGKVDLMDIQTNTFCSSGMHLPNGSFSVFGGNGAVAIGGGNPDDNGWDSILQDFDGSRAIRTISPCTSSEDFSQASCQWVDAPGSPTMMMQAQRWYSSAEALANGTIVLMGGFTGGGYILRVVPNTDPTIGASLTYEFWPNTNNQAPQNLQFLFETSALNAYPHAYLMASGKMFLQANLSTALWDVESNTEEALPPMPNGVVRVYPASGATAMMPMTPANNWTQTMIFCGGSNISEPEWGNFSFPFVNTWDVPASNDCQEITPEGDAIYHQVDGMPVGRTMGQFIILPTGKLLVVNGGANGTAGYGTNNLLTPQQDMPFQESFASAPVGTPAVYDPLAPLGSRWSTEGFDTSPIARLYHSSAMLLPDGSVLIAGSNPNLDVNTTAVTFPTEYRAEKFYPPYFNATVRPNPSGVPSKLSYGGLPFDILVPASSYSGSGDAAAESAQVNVIRPGWTTHGMNMGQRFLQLNNTYTVNKNSSITLHVAQMPPNANLFQPGPAFIYVVVNDIPSNATYTIVGSGNIEEQPLSSIADLPVSVKLASATGTAGSSGSWFSTHIDLVAGIAGGVVFVALAALVVGICLSRRRAARRRAGIAAGRAARADQDMAFASASVPPMGMGGINSSPYGAVPPRSPGPMAHGFSHSQVFLNHKASESSDAWSHADTMTMTDTDSAVWENHAQTHVPAMSGLRQQPYRDEVDQEFVGGAEYGHGQPPQHQHQYQPQQQQQQQQYGYQPGDYQGGYRHHQHQQYQPSY